jgi:hypothetical protein
MIDYIDILYIVFAVLGLGFIIYEVIKNVIDFF